MKVSLVAVFGQKTKSRVYRPEDVVSIFSDDAFLHVFYFEPGNPTLLTASFAHPTGLIIDDVPGFA